MIDETIYKVSEIDNYTLHLIDDKLKETITHLRKRLTQSRKKLRILTAKISERQYKKNNCHKTLEGISITKISEWQYK